MTSLEQLSLAEFSGEYARSKVYENDHKNVLGVWRDLISNVKYKEWRLKKETTFAFGQFTTISGHFFANYINIFHNI